jgi:DNA modification methylase
MNSITILTGDNRKLLSTLPDESVQCCVTSPPYWGLRDYGHADQIGQEATPAEYVASLVSVFEEVRRVLRADGTLWLNLGDSYCSQGGSHDGRTDNQPGVGAARVWRNGGGRADGIVDERGQRNRNGNAVKNLKPKDLIGIPWMVAFALREAGWWLRSEIIWHKPNPMPESVTDRPTSAHEKLFLLAKSETYYYDAGAIREQGAEPERERSDKIGGANGHKVRHSEGGVMGASATRNKRNVWSVPIAPYADAHFATYPPALIAPCILAGTKPGDVVLDPFGGSGTTGKVALELGRRAILIELNPDYAKLIEKRTTTTVGFGF